MPHTIAELFNLKGKAAIVTGGAMGIGQAISFRLAEAGAAVMIADIDEEAARQTVEKIEADGGKAESMRADVSSAADAGEIARMTVEAFGGVDILVNNAGVYPVTPLDDITEDLWDKVLDINLKGTFLCSQAVARQMIKAEHGGKIVNLGSRAGIHPNAGMAHYCTSKAGVMMLTKSLALELAPHNILVNAVAPGVVLTPGALKQMQSKPKDEAASKIGLENLLARMPLRRIGEPDDIARVVLFLASKAADYMTGTMLLADGGYELS